MPTLLRWNGFRFYFFSSDGDEPPHVHIDRDAATAKYWLSPVRLARNVGLNARDLRLVEDKVSEEQGRFLEAWHGYFGRSS
jgi:hypothetical protein